MDTHRSPWHRRLPRLTGMIAATLVASMVGAGTAAGPAAASAPLRVHASALGMHIGATVDPQRLATDPNYASAVATEFNSITPVNTMTWQQLQPSQGSFNFGAADIAASFGNQHAQLVRGTALVWHEQVPAWVQNLSGAPLRQAMHHHIHTVVGRYHGAVGHWEVVNEPMAENGTLRDTFWLQGLGTDYISDALHTARIADPSATLYLNDYGTAGINAKSNGLYNLAQQLLASGVPLDGVGIRGDLLVGQVPASLPQNLQRFADLGLEVSITELRIRAPHPVSPPDLHQQAVDYATVVGACIAVTGCAGITVGTYAHQSWLPSLPGPGTSPQGIGEWLPKPIYQSVHDTLAGAAPPIVPPAPPPPPAARR